MGLFDDIAQAWDDSNRTIASTIWDYVRNPLGFPGTVYDEIIESRRARTGERGPLTTTEANPTLAGILDTPNIGVDAIQRAAGGTLASLRGLSGDALRTAERIATVVQWVAVIVLVLAGIIALVLLFVAAAWIRRSMGDAKVLADAITMGAV